MLPGLETIFLPESEDRWRGAHGLSLAFLSSQQTTDPGWRVLRRGILQATCTQSLPGVLPRPGSVWRTGLWPTSAELEGGGLVVLDFW